MTRAEHYEREAAEAGELARLHNTLDHVRTVLNSDLEPRLKIRKIAMCLNAGDPR